MKPCKVCGHERIASFEIRVLVFNDGNEKEFVTAEICEDCLRAGGEKLVKALTF